MIRDKDGTHITQAPRTTRTLIRVPGPEAELSEIRLRLLRMADEYRHDDFPHQAIAIYLELAEEHADSAEGRQARDRLMAMAAEYEQQGRQHHAYAIYEWLMEPVVAE